MKSFREVEANRINYHKSTNKNTVHRSSLIVPRFNHAISNISFVNHFLLKRNNSDVMLKITAINEKGIADDSLSFEIDEPKVYSFNLESYFKNRIKIKEYLVEFYSDKNLFIPFPAVMINHIGSDFVNCVHSYNRVLNDVFEDDKVNEHKVYESSIDVSVNKDYDTFFNFATGPFYVKKNLEVLLAEKSERSKKIPIEMCRLTNRNIFLSDIYKKKNIKGDLLVKILQPEQPLFYGRLLAGKINRKTKSFSANHSYYDSSSNREYFKNNISMRAYPFFNNCLNKITMYPIMSPSTLEISVEIYKKNKTYKSKVKKLKSPSNSPISFDINSLVKESGFKDVSMFKVVAKSTKGKIPTRVNHQLIYGDQKSNSKLQSSINVSLGNESIYSPPHRTGMIWGQVLSHKSYKSKLGICFNNNTGASDKVSIDFFSQKGFIKSIKRNLTPDASIILDNDFFNKLNISNEFIWYIVRSKRADLQAESFHYHLKSGNASGEHNF